MAMDRWPRHDVHTRTIDGGHVEVYWRHDQLVDGPCISVTVEDVEVLRIDLPTRPDGRCHEHWYGLHGQPRLYYPRTWPHDQVVELGLSNLVEHTHAACALVGVTAPSRLEMVEAAEWAAELIT